jgi:hypothetical protein
LRAAKLGLEAFLELALRVQAISASQAAALGVTAALALAAAEADAEASGPSRAAGGSNSSSIVAAGTGSIGGRSRGLDAATLRSQKIERFKQNTAAKSQLRELALANARRAQLAGKSGDGEEFDGVGKCDSQNSASLSYESKQVGTRRSSSFPALLSIVLGAAPREDESDVRKRVSLALQISVRQAVDDLLQARTSLSRELSDS